MNFQFISYLIPLFISSIITLGLAVYGYKYRSVKGAKPFVISMVIGTLWAIAHGLEMAGTDLSTKLFWANFQYFCYAFAPLTWVIMVFEFTGKESWVNKRNIILMAIIPVVTIILVWTNQYHHLIRYNVKLNLEGTFSVIDKEYGPWFWVHSVYSYALNSSAILLLMRASWRRNTIYRKQVFCLFVGFLILFLSSFLYVIGISPIERFDISPVLFSISGMIMSWGIFHFRLFDLVPIARTTVIEEMATGIIVIDRKNRVIDINPGARNMLGFNDRDSGIGQQLLEISDRLTELAGFIASRNRTELIQEEFSFENEGTGYYYELFSSPIRDYRGEPVARILLINDITDLKQARDQISKQQQQLAVMNERERMARDLHDNLGQVLSFSSVQIQAARQQFKKENLQQADEYLAELKKIIRDAHKKIREYVYNIRNNDVYQEGFLELLQRLTGRFRKNSEININFKTNFSNPRQKAKKKLNSCLGTEEKIQLTNIVKEALTNVLKYAGAGTVNVCVNTRGGQLRVVVEDDGQGIARVEKENGSGINIMNERARLIEGELTIETEPGVGTRVIVTLPLVRRDNCEDNDS